MISKTWSRKPIAAVVAVAILSVYSMVALASPGAKAPSGELSIAGQVTVNGETAVTGGTVFSESIITTAEKSVATVNLSKLGRVELSPSSNLKLSFTDKSISGLLENGTARISTLAGTSVNFTTKDGVVVVDGSQATSFTVNVVKGVTSLTTISGIAQLHVGSTVKQVAAGESASAGTPTPKNDPGDDDDKMSGGELAALLLLGAGAVAGILYAAMHNNDLNFGGTAIVISPAK
jgi:ferric-dicitrate binding protein FerR (iron transport regulator)